MATMSSLLVVDSHPDTTHTLRIDQPFPSLLAYSRDLNFDGMDSMEHSHVPWVVLLVRAATVWRESVSSRLDGANRSTMASFPTRRRRRMSSRSSFRAGAAKVTRRTLTRHSLRRIAFGHHLWYRTTLLSSSRIQPLSISRAT